MRRALAWAGRNAMLVGALAGPADRADDLEAQLTGELVNQVFETKVPVASAWLDPTMRAESRYRPVSRYRWVDTEIGEDGRLAYLVRKMPLLSKLPGNFYLQADEVSVMLPRGSNVLVKKLDFKDDRVEVQLQSMSDGHHAKIKLMEGKGFVDTASFMTVMKSLSRVVKLERFEQALELQTRGEEARRRLAEALNALRRLEAARELRQALTEIQAIGGVQSGSYQDELDELGRTIAELEPQARTLRIEEIRAQLASGAREESTLKASLRTVATAADLDKQARMVDRWEAILKARIPLAKEMSALGEALPAGASDAAGLDEISKLRAALDAQRGKLEKTRIDSQYQEMATKRIALLDVYTRAFASPNEGAALQRLVDHLRLMVANREQAAKFGSPAAAGQAANLSKELGDFERKMR